MASLKSSWLGLALLVALVPAQAADKVSMFRQQPLTYLTGTAGVAQLKFDKFTIDSPILGVGMGAMVNKYVGVEVRLARSVMRKEYQDSRFALDHLASASATLRFPLWRFIYGQAYVGASNAKLVSISPSRDTERTDRGSLSYGLDVGIRVIPHWRVSAGYSRYLDESDWQVDAIEGHLQYLF